MALLVEAACIPTDSGSTSLLVKIELIVNSNWHLKQRAHMSCGLSLDKITVLLKDETFGPMLWQSRLIQHAVRAVALSTQLLTKLGKAAEHGSSTRAPGLRGDQDGVSGS